MDIEAGKRAGTLTVGIVNQYTSTQTFEQAGADIILKRLDEIRSLSVLTHGDETRTDNGGR